MILFERPLLLLLGVIWLAFWIVLLRKQKSALDWILANTSERFRHTLTRYGRHGLLWHMGFILLVGFCLILSAAGPYAAGKVEKEELSGNIVLILDASFSMAAADVPETDGVKFRNRLLAAKYLSQKLIEAMPQHRFALLSFSGISAMHSPPTDDHQALLTFLNTMTLHSFQNTGSSFGAAFSGLIHMIEHTERSYQAVLISDGELPHPDQYADELKILRQRDVRVHTIAVGSTEGGGIRILDPDDLRQGRTKPRVLRKVTTQRTDKHLKEIASQTGGSFAVFGDENLVADLKSEIEGKISKKAIVRAPGRRDLSRWPLALFLCFFLVETIIIARPGKVAQARGSWPLLLLVPLLWGSLGCENSLHRAHIRNEQGIVLYHLRQYSMARQEFEASAGFTVREEVPTFNLAKNHAANEDFAEAHNVYQRAMELNPDLVEALYNDGHALYEWGRKELRLEKGKECQQSRTIELWKQSLQRFVRTREMAPEGSKLSAQASSNIDFLAKQLGLLAKMQEKCPGQSGGSKQEQEKSEDQSKKQDGKSGSGEPEQKKESKQQSGKAEAKKGEQGGKSSGNSEQGPASGKEEEKRGSVGMSKNEQERINKELERIRRQARENKRHNQSKAQQLPGKPSRKKGGGKSGGPPVWW